MEDTWFSPGQVFYDRKQMVLLLEYLDILEEGYWLPNFCITGYTDIARVQISPSNKAAFEIPILIATEVNRRLTACGQDGEILRAYYTDGWGVDRIARITGIRENQIDRIIKRALNYISSGQWRRWVDHYKKDKDGKKVFVKGISYKEWISHRKERNIRTL